MKKPKDLMVRRNMLPENDAELSNFVDNILQNKKLIELVKIMQPLDIAKVIIKDLGLQPKNAIKATFGLLTHASADTENESMGGMGTGTSAGMSGANIETNKQYPVPPTSRRDPKKEKDESALARPQGKTVWGHGAPPDIPRHHFPPDPRSEPGGWPYDDMTTAGMDPKNKGRKRPLNMGKEVPEPKDFEKKRDKKYVFVVKSIEDQGADGGGGIHSKVKSGGDQPGTGKGWSRHGVAGWSKSPTGQEFDLPDDIKEEDDEEDEVPNFMENPPVGASAPHLGFGGREPGRRMGFRKK